MIKNIWEGDIMEQMEQKQLFSFMQDCFIKRQALGPLHQKAMDLFRLYMTIGGMPQVVQEYINTKTL